MRQLGLAQFFQCSGSHHLDMKILALPDCHEFFLATFTNHRQGIYYCSVEVKFSH